MTPKGKSAYHRRASEPAAPIIPAEMQALVLDGIAFEHLGVHGRATNGNEIGSTVDRTLRWLSMRRRRRIRRRLQYVTTTRKTKKRSTRVYGRGLDRADAWGPSPTVNIRGRSCGTSNLDAGPVRSGNKGFQSRTLGHRIGLEDLGWSFL